MENKNREMLKELKELMKKYDCEVLFNVRGLCHARLGNIAEIKLEECSYFDGDEFCFGTQRDMLKSRLINIYDKTEKEAEEYLNSLDWEDVIVVHLEPLYDF